MSHQQPSPITTREVRRGAIRYGGSLPPLVIAGPDSLESIELALEIAEHLAELASRLEICLVFKASFDKANRSSASSYRGEGIERGLEQLALVRERTGLPITSDVHDVEQTRIAGEVLDIIQIPAFLCRQNDLLAAAGETGKFVNVKKGQFLSPAQVPSRVAVASGPETPGVLVTERGTFFGYGDLVNDMRSIPRIRQQGSHVVFDATHSVQQPGALGDRSGGEAELIPFIARAAAGAGCDGFFFEVHPRPEEALCDGPSSLRLEHFEDVLRDVIAIDRIGRHGRRDANGS